MCGSEDPLGESKPFSSAVGMQSFVPLRVWIGIRYVAVSFLILLIAISIIWPEWGLRITWNILVPLIPIIILIAPGLWRNVCPIATINQIPQKAGLTFGDSLPDAFRRYSYLIAIGLFVLILSLRHIILNGNGIALAMFLIAVVVLAFAGGIAFKGKSGWCTQICPMYPVEHVYGQNPLVVVRDQHCQPCVGCTKNCIDLIPQKAFLSDLKARTELLSIQRRLFTGLLPGLTFSFFHNADLLAGSPWYLVYGIMLIPAMASVEIFFVLDIILKGWTQRLSAIFTVVTLNIFYWYSFPNLLGQVGDVLSLISLPATVVAAGAEFNLSFRASLYVALAALSIIWLKRTMAKERSFARRLDRSHSTR